MKLYHGTSRRALAAILTQGLQPRGTRVGNFSHSIESCPEAIYLTTCYSIYFSVIAADDHQGAIIEIDTDLLDEEFFNADEDVLEQAGRGRDGLPEAWDMRQRTRYYSEKLLKTRWSWEKSLEAMGTCSYLADIPPTAFTRIALIDYKMQGMLRLSALDAMICLANYRFCSYDYQRMTAWVFDDPLDAIEPDASLAELLSFKSQIGPPAYMKSRKGIQVLSPPFKVHDFDMAQVE